MNRPLAYLIFLTMLAFYNNYTAAEPAMQISDNFAAVNSTFQIAQVDQCSISDCATSCPNADDCIANGGAVLNCRAKEKQCLDSCAMKCANP